MRAPLGTRAWRKLTFMVTAGSAGGEAAAGRGEEALDDILAESVKGEVGASALTRALRRRFAAQQRPAAR